MTNKERVRRLRTFARDLRAGARRVRSPRWAVREFGLPRDVALWLAEPAVADGDDHQGCGWGSPVDLDRGSHAAVFDAVADSLEARPGEWPSVRWVIGMSLSIGSR